MKLLLVGSGGREHALAATLARENTNIELLATPGNPGIGEYARLFPDIAATNVRAIGELAERENVKLVIVGPEAPLAEGLVDHLQTLNVPAFGPSRAAARVETSKADTKSMMLSAGIPTAHAETHRLASTAREAVRVRFGAPVVIKASGLAAGKGVFVCSSVAEADAAIDRILGDRAFGEAGNECLVEEFMSGEELSVFAVCDGTHALPMIAAQDHKRLLEGDDGPNTGGMGAYAPVSLGTPPVMDAIMERVLLPTLHAMRRAGSPFSGLLYAGIMLTESGPKVVEFNCRFGDPETQAILPLLTSSLLEPMMSVARGGSVNNMSGFAFQKAVAVTTVVAASGYPQLPRVGEEIHLPSFPDNIAVFHAGTARNATGRLVTSGGRVVTVTAIAQNFEEARTASRSAASQIGFEGAQYRRDIGWREAEREAAQEAAREAVRETERQAARGA